MKTIIVFLLLALILMTYNETKAQGCDSPCGPNWLPAVPLPVSLNGCSYKVEFEVQYCESGDPDHPYCLFHIIRLYDFNPSGCNLQNSAKDLLDAASIKIIMWAPELPCKPNGANDCKEHIQSYKAACWKWDNVVNPGGGQLPELIPCDMISCCESHWMFCNDAGGNPMDPYKTYERTSVPCSIDDDPGCIVVCEEMGQ